METHNWLGFENEDREEKAGRAEYADYLEQSSMSPEDEQAHALYVQRVAAEYGFTLSDWQPMIPTRDLV